MEIRDYCVYKHTSPNGKVYIGITKQEPQKRWKNGRGYSNSVRFMNAINKYGWDSFTHEVLAEGISKVEAEVMEVRLIALYDSTNPENGYNLASGGNANTPNAETKSKISKSVQRAWSDSETRDRIVDGMNGVKRSDESKANISSAQRKRFARPEERLRVSERQVGKTKSEESKQKTSESLIRYYSDENNRNKLKEIRRALRNRAVAIRCIDTGEIFNAVVDAENKYSISHQNIIKVCKGQRKTAGGLRWEYVEG